MLGASIVVPVLAGAVAAVLTGAEGGVRAVLGRGGLSLPVVRGRFSAWRGRCAGRGGYTATAEAHGRAWTNGVSGSEAWVPRSPLGGPPSSPVALFYVNESSLTHLDRPTRSHGRGRWRHCGGRSPTQCRPLPRDSDAAGSRDREPTARDGPLSKQDPSETNASHHSHEAGRVSPPRRERPSRTPCRRKLQHGNRVTVWGAAANAQQRTSWAGPVAQTPSRGAFQPAGLPPCMHPCARFFSRARMACTLTHARAHTHTHRAVGATTSSMNHDTTPRHDPNSAEPRRSVDIAWLTPPAARAALTHR